MKDKNSKKRKVSSFIAYKKNEGKVFVYLQKRSDNAERHPGYFTPFGGGSENDENPQETLIREMREELNYFPKDYELLKTYNFDWGIASVFVEEVGEDFESKIKVSEGDYGKFLSEDEALTEPKLADDDKITLRDLFKKLHTVA